MEPLVLLTNTTAYACANAATTQTVLLSISTGLFGAFSIASCAYMYLFCQRLRKVACPYCDELFTKEVVREHLQTCPEHLKNYKLKGRASIATEIDRKAFYSSSMKKLLMASELQVEEP